MTTEAVFTFATTHHALGAEKALLAAGLRVRIMSRPSALGEGCGICIRVDEAALDEAKRVCAEDHIVVEGMYWMTRESGVTRYREV